MYAIIKSGGKQYRVKKDDVIDVELLEGQPGEKIEFKDVLFIHDGSNAKVGGPFISGMTVFGELLGESKGEKITSVKYIPGNHYRKFGHRQKYSRVKITAIGEHKEKEHKEHKEREHKEHKEREHKEHKEHKEKGKGGKHGA